MPLPARSLSARVLVRLISAEVREIDPWLRDDLRIARLTVAYAAHEDAVLCSPDVLASYMVLGLHPEKVWPAIQARRIALGPVGDVPKKPPQAVNLWSEKTIGARAANSRAGSEMVLRGPRLLPMATASIAALYRNSDAPSSTKEAAYTLGELKQIVYYSGAEHAVRALTFSALEARGPWPKQDGPATPVISVSVTGMMIDGNCCRRTVYYRIQRALGLGYWRHTRRANSWTDCPKCGEKRRIGKCAKCGYQGQVKGKDGKYTGEFTRSNVYQFDVHKFIAAPRCREIRSVDWRTYAEYKEAAKRGEHPNVTEMPRKTPAPVQPPRDPAPTAPLPAREKPAAHRSPSRSVSSARKLTPREGPKLVNEMRRLMQGCKGYVGQDRLWVDYKREDARYRDPMSQEQALLAACMNLAIPEASARDFLKLLPRENLGDGEKEQT